MKPDSILKRLFDRDTDPLPCADVCFAEHAGSFDYSDVFTEETKKIRSIQLLDTKLWKRLVEFFRDGDADSEDATWRCEYWGKIMRGACFVYRASPASSPDDELYAVLEATVRDLLTTQDPLGRISTYTVEREFTGWDIWGRKYVMLGLLYFLRICRDAELRGEIVSALCAHADYMISKLGQGDGKREIAACSNAWDGLNSCSILEPFVLLWNETKDPKYLEFSEYIASFGGTLHENFFKAALEDKTPLSEYSQPKAYEMISCFEGLAELSKVNGDEDARGAVIKFADRMLREEATVIGCLGCDSECLNHASVMQSDGSFVPSFDFKGEIIHIMQETCVTVTWMKFMWQLWRMTGDSKYMDAFETSMYNAMSGALKDEIHPEENGGVILPVHSYSPLRDAARSSVVGGQLKITDDSLYGCCVAISSAGFALDTIASAAHDHNGTLYLNLYRSGKVTSGGTVIDISTDYPRTGVVKIKIESVERYSRLALRIPEWAAGADVTLNGSTRSYKPGYAEHDIASGDEIVLTLPMEVRCLTPDDAADVRTGRDDYVCVCRGPVVYALDYTGDEPTYAIDEKSDAALVNKAAVPCRSALEISTVGGETVTLVDYRSAGQIRGHKVSAWIKIK